MFTVMMYRTGSVVRPENVNVATRFLHLALWCSLIRVRLSRRKYSATHPLSFHRTGSGLTDH